MNADLAAAWKYLSSPAGSFWKWADDGQVVVWSHNGSTIAFREELAAVLSRLAPRGLPPMDAVLLLIAATREHWPADSERLRERLRSTDSLFVSWNAEGITPAYALTLLDRVRELPRDLTPSVDAKVELAAVVFETAESVVSPRIAELVCEAVWYGLIREYNQIVSLPRLRGGRPQTSKSLVRDLWLLRSGLEDVSEESLRMRLRTGLDEEPATTTLEVSVEPSEIRSLLHRLGSDDELGGLARLARNLSAVVQWPRAISDTDELPLGGVSDLTHRGSLDRLLLSELAHDDLMLATRVALNEALYLRREAPTSQPPEHRHVLIDAGLRMWGVPRVFSTAVVLSLASSGYKGASLSAYRAAGKRIVTVDVASREGLISHLEALEPAAHPGAALGEFFRHVASGEQPCEVIFVTTDAVLDDPDFRRDWRESDAPGCYLATVNRDGEFRLWAQAARGRKCLAALRLDLDDLLKPPARPAARLVDKTVDLNLPAIFRTKPFPLRLPSLRQHDPQREVVWSVPHRGVYEQALTATTVAGYDGQPALTASESLPPTRDVHGVMILTRDRRLLFFHDSKRGGIELAEGIPFGRCLWSGTSRDDHLCYSLIHREAEPALYLLVINIVLNRVVVTTKLQSEFLSRSGAGSKLKGAAVHAGVLFVIYESAREVFDFAEGSLLHRVDIDPRLQWRRDRFFFDTRAPAYEEWSVLSFDGAAACFEPIRLRGPERTGILLTLFERRGHDGPFGVHFRGSIANLSNQTEWEWTTNPRSNPRVLDIDEDGTRLLIEQDPEERGQTTRIRRIVHLDSRRVEEIRGSASTLAQCDASRMNLGPQLPHRFTKIAAETDGSLVLVSKRGVPWRFVHVGNVLSMIQLNQVHQPQATRWAGGRTTKSFEQAMHLNPGCTLSVATWDDGSRAFIDSRGLLHLQSSDLAIPEATLVLHEHNVAGWTNDGQVFGSSYYWLDDSLPQLTAEEVVSRILRPFAERLR